MIDIKVVRTDAERIRQGIANRGGRFLPVLEELLTKDSRYREILRSVESLRAQRKDASGKIGRLRAQKKESEAVELLKEADRVKTELASKEEELTVLEKEVQLLSMGLPNIPDASVPVGGGPEYNKVCSYYASFNRV